MELVTKRDMEDAERLGEAMGFNLEHEWPEMVHDVAQAIADGRRPTPAATEDEMTEMIRLMEKISAAENVILYDERGSDSPLSDDEIEAILQALAAAVRHADQ